MNKISVISPASASRKRKGAVIDQGCWDDEFLGRAEEKDETGFPMKGSFGLSFAVTFDLSKVPTSALEGQAVSAIKTRGASRGIFKTNKEATANAKQLISAFKSLKKGDIVAFKKGTKVIAIVELTSEYTFRGEQKWGWHSWSYRTLKKVSDSEQPSNYKGLLKTFMPNYMAMPEGIFTSKTYSVPNGAWAWA
jgi:hypothetical protein